MSKQQFALDDYNDVASRIAEFREKHPDGSLQQLAVDFREVAGGWWVIYTAAAYRTPDDTRPGHGTAWEPIPGKTPYTRDSELQNCETAAWGRAIVAALAADTKKGVASAEEARHVAPPTLAELLSAAERADSADQLSTVARRAVAVHAAAHLSDGELEQIKQAVTARRAELADRERQDKGAGA